MEEDAEANETQFKPMAKHNRSNLEDLGLSDSNNRQRFDSDMDVDQHSIETQFDESQRFDYNFDINVDQHLIETQFDETQQFDNEHLIETQFDEELAAEKTLTPEKVAASALVPADLVEPVAHSSNARTENCEAADTAADTEGAPSMGFRFDPAALVFDVTKLEQIDPALHHLYIQPEIDVFAAPERKNFPNYTLFIYDSLHNPALIELMKSKDTHSLMALESINRNKIFSGRLENLSKPPTEYITTQYKKLSGQAPGFKFRRVKEPVAVDGYFYSKKNLVEIAFFLERRTLFFYV
ncbi:uncharacterized protein LOC129576892 [Sitodiplosis mosellana]|uniref:uncharacterized protein LOC129576892 n=1 Tax=Sitodiplosis mosellana TaxID=263140 RepID=UPI002444E31B|nr:uncharacterized protein LOC129576892 [Sitodiplosis mosellana]XP_055318955.1 uncharacterized protein LOC129576892 [Sitodiplosis mosellana]XP_055318956.1 uncharacterized protein LOC129576892 [Sitodiplosis mosellana]